jgi:two-component system chemotaxis response regulator CheB
MVVARRPGGGYIVRLEDTPPLRPFRPSVDKLMLSVAEAYGSRSVGVILSGMGSDGVAGMEEIKRVGGCTIVQDEETSVVFGMPGAIIERGVADKVLPVDQISSAVVEALQKMEHKHASIRV